MNINALRLQMRQGWRVQMKFLNQSKPIVVAQLRSVCACSSPPTTPAIRHLIYQVTAFCPQWKSTYCPQWKTDKVKEWWEKWKSEKFKEWWEKQNERTEAPNWP